MSTMASQITGVSIVYSPVFSCADQRKHQSSAPLVFVRELTGEFPTQGASNRKKCFHLMTSSCFSTISFAWIHYIDPVTKIIIKIKQRTAKLWACFHHSVETDIFRESKINITATCKEGYHVYDQSLFEGWKMQYIYLKCSSETISPM